MVDADRQTFDIPLQGGLADKISEATKPLGALQSAVNIRQNKTGQYSARNGYLSLGNVVEGIGSSDDYRLVDGNSIHVRNGIDLLVLGNVDNDGTVEPRVGTGFIRRVQNAIADFKGTEWNWIGAAVPCEMKVRQVSPLVFDGPSSNSITAVAHHTGAATRTNTHQVFFHKTLTDEVLECRIFDRNGNYITPYDISRSFFTSVSYRGYSAISVNNQSTYQRVFVFYVDEADRDLKYGRVDMTNPHEYMTAGTFATGTFGGVCCAEISDDLDNFILAYVDSAAATVVLYRLDANLATVWGATTIMSGATDADRPAKLVVDVANNRVHVFCRDSVSNTIYHTSLNLTTGAVVGSPVDTTYPFADDDLELTAAMDTQYGSTIARVFITASAGGDLADDVNSYAWNTSTQADAALNVTFSNCGLISDAFTYNKRAYVALGMEDLTTFGVSEGYLATTIKDYSANTAGAQLVTKFLNSAYTWSTDPSQVGILEDGRFLIATAAETNVVAASGEKVYNAIEFDLRPPPAQSVSVANSSLVACGLLHSVTDQATELGIHQAPQVSAFTNGAGGTMSAGTHSVRCIMVWADSSGRVHRSEPSVAVSDTFTANDDYDITVQHPLFTNRRGYGSNSYYPAYLEIYLTTANGSIHYFHQKVNLSGGSRTSLTNQTVTDAVLLTGAILYTDTGELGAGSPPATNRIAASPERVFCIPDDNRKVVRYSKPIVNGIAPEFPFEFEQVINCAEDLDAIAVMDGRIIVLSRSEIYWFAGEGPSATGVGTWSQVQKIQTNNGIVDRNSLVETEDGLMYKGPRGTSLLDRGLQVSYIGAGADDSNFTLAKNKIFAATRLQDAEEVRFVLGHDEYYTDTQYGVVTRAQALQLLVYDSYHKQWYLDEFNNATLMSSANFNSIIDTAIWKGVFVALCKHSSGRTMDVLYEENARSTLDGLTLGWQDAGQTYDASFRSGWVNPAGLIGSARLLRIAVRGVHQGTSHDLRVKIYINGDSTTAVVDKTFISIATVIPYVFRLRLPSDKQKIHTFMVEVLLPGGSAGEHARFHGITIEAELVGGIKPQPTSRSY